MRTPFIFVRVKSSRRVKVMLADILYVESQKDCSLLHIKGQPEPMKIWSGISELTALLKPHGVLRVHRGFSVNVSAIKTIEAEHLMLEGSHFIPFGGTTYTDDFFKILEEAGMLVI